MHKIYLEKRCMIVCSPDEQALSDPNSIELHLGENPDISSLVSMFEASEKSGRIYIPTSDIEGTYKSFCSRFKEVNAAGGLVSNRREDVLLISRNGLWVFPKDIRRTERTSGLRPSGRCRRKPGWGDLELRG